MRFNWAIFVANLVPIIAVMYIQQWTGRIRMLRDKMRKIEIQKRN